MNMISTSRIVFYSLLLLAGVLHPIESQRARRRNVRNDTKTVTLENGRTLTINNYINCPNGNDESKTNTETASELQSITDDRGCPLTSYEFPQSQQTTDYIRVKTPLPDMHNGTICAWIKTGKDGIIKGTIASYATSTQFNSIILYGRRGNGTTPILDVFINDEGYYTPLSLPANKKVHFCAAFSVVYGYVKLFVDGSLSQTVSRFKKGMIVEGGGVFIIGQEQDGLASGFAEDQSYKGTVENFMMWDRELTPKEVRDMATKGCRCPSDYILSLRHDAVTLVGGVAAKVMKKCPADE